MLPDDVLCRAASYPKAFKAGVFDIEQFFRFDEEHGGGGAYAISVASKFLLRCDEAVHAYGQSIADLQNQRSGAANGQEPDRRVRYLAFYEGKCSIVSEIAMKHYTLVVRYRPVTRGDAHFQIEMWPTRSTSTKKERRTDRGDAARAIATQFSGPITMGRETYDPDDLDLLDRLPILPVVEAD